VDHVKASKCSS